MLWKATGVDIWIEISLEKAATCLLMYMRNVILDQRPIFLMVLWGAPCKCMAMASPTQRLWLPTWVGWRPFWWRSKMVTADLTAWLMLWAVSSCRNGWAGVKTVLRMVAGLVMWSRIWLRRWMNALHGHVCDLVASWWTTWPSLPFFWLEILSVAAVQCWSKYWWGKVISSYRLVAQRATSCRQNWAMRLWSDFLW